MVRIGVNLRVNLYNPYILTFFNACPIDGLQGVAVRVRV